MRAAWIEVDLEQIRKNVRFLKGKIDASTKFMAVVKADAYGHGAIEVARILQEEGASHFAVAFVEEGVELRQNGITEPILVLGHQFLKDYQSLLDFNLMPTISTMKQAEAMDKYAKEHNKIITAHIKIDTGMGRLGFTLDENVVESIKLIAGMQGLYIEGIFSHLATAPQLSDTSYCELQFSRFTNLLKEIADAGIKIPIRHISNSGATILFPHMQLDMVRPGTALYGLYAGDELESINDVKVYPAMEIKAKLGHIKKVDIGTKVSYNSTFEAKQPTVLGVVPLGYVDGIFRNLANKGEVLLHGKRCKIVGNVCMDQFVIDITHVENPSECDEIVIVGKQGDEYISAEEIAKKSGTISIEVLCGLGKRISRIFKQST